MYAISALELAAALQVAALCLSPGAGLLSPAAYLPLLPLLLASGRKTARKHCTSETQTEHSTDRLVSFADRWAFCESSFRTLHFSSFSSLSEFRASLHRLLP